ncbi:hypothetical protein [Vibrio maritimus]|uniref:hypothetical protein n=1 Tax=Vibrio maritimus TaxID=990268 RepID=UPI001F21BBAE|nr:hypothetical protein [Vibrio maritimus]
MRLTLLILSIHSPAAFSFERLNGLYLKGLYGSQETAGFELGVTNDNGYGFFFGVGIGQDDQRMGTIDNKDDAQSPTLLGSYTNVSKANGNFGPNYTHHFQSDWRLIAGLGVDLTYYGSYTNWYESSEKLGDRGFFWYPEDSGLNIGATLSVNGTYKNALFGANYRTFRNEVLLSVGYRYKI